jgi:hypothetical protein
LVIETTFCGEKIMAEGPVLQPVSAKHIITHNERTKCFIRVILF